MLVVWALLFLGVLAGLVRVSEAVRNGWNPLAAPVEAAPMPVLDEKVMHICTDAQGVEFKQEAACPEIIKTVSDRKKK